MADQVKSGTVQGASTDPSGHQNQGSLVERAEGPLPPGRHEPFHGRPVSWVAVTTIIIGFLLGGVGLVTGPTWWLVWAGGAVVVVGGILGLATGIVNDWY